MFAIATEFFDETPGAFSHRQIGIDFTRQGVEAGAKTERKRIGRVQLQSFGDDVKLADNV